MKICTMLDLSLKLIQNISIINILISKISDYKRKKIKQEQKLISKKDKLGFKR